MPDEIAPMRPLAFQRRTSAEMLWRARELYTEMAERRSVRTFSPDRVPLEVVRTCIDIASTAPSGAHKQPWTFVLVTDPATKRRIRAGAEEEERAFYGERAPERWLRDLEPLGTDADKPFLESAPALIAVFAQRHGATADERHYYVNESVGIAVGFLLAALHLSGLATLTHTPSPMHFLGEILDRPSNERAFLLIPVGYPADDCRVPDLDRKSRGDVLVEI